MNEQVKRVVMLAWGSSVSPGQVWMTMHTGEDRDSLVHQSQMLLSREDAARLRTTVMQGIGHGDSFTGFFERGWVE